MKLTPTQKAILMHRIGSGCIADCLVDSEVCTLPNAEAAVEAVERMVEAGIIPLERLLQPEIAVLVDCLDGSTYFAGFEDAVAGGEATRSQLRTADKAADGLEDEFSKAFGMRVRCVRS